MPDIGELTNARLREAGVRPTRQSRALARLLFVENKEAVTAEGLHALAVRRGIAVSLATVYRTLHSYWCARLARDITIDARRYYDTNLDNHQYFYFEDEDRLVGVTEAEAGVTAQPKLPQGMHVSRLDVVVRLKRDEAHHRG